MILVQGIFIINADYKGRGELSELIINPNKNYFSVISEGKIISRLTNPGRGVWEQIEGDLLDTEIASIGQAIDNRYLPNNKSKDLAVLQV